MEGNETFAWNEDHPHTKKLIELSSNTGEDIRLWQLREPIGFKYGWFSLTNVIVNSNTGVHVGHPNYQPKTYVNPGEIGYDAENSPKRVGCATWAEGGRSGSPLIDLDRNKVIGVAYLGGNYTTAATFVGIWDELVTHLNASKLKYFPQAVDFTNITEITIHEDALPLKIKLKSKNNNRVGTALRWPTGNFKLVAKKCKRAFTVCMSCLSNFLPFYLSI